MAVALYDYEAGEDNEISCVEGDLITNIEFVSEDWWQGLAADKKTIGLFPGKLPPRKYIYIYIKYTYCIK